MINTASNNSSTKKEKALNLSDIIEQYNNIKLLNNDSNPNSELISISKEIEGLSSQEKELKIESNALITIKQKLKLDIAKLRNLQKECFLAEKIFEESEESEEIFITEKGGENDFHMDNSMTTEKIQAFHGRGRLSSFEWQENARKISKEIELQIIKEYFDYNMKKKYFQDSISHSSWRENSNFSAQFVEKIEKNQKGDIEASEGFMDEVIETFAESHSVWTKFSKEVEMDPYIEKFRTDTVFAQKLYDKHLKGLDINIKDIQTYYYKRMIRYNSSETIKRKNLDYEKMVSSLSLNHAEKNFAKSSKEYQIKRKEYWSQKKKFNSKEKELIIKEQELKKDIEEQELKIKIAGKRHRENVENLVDTTKSNIEKTTNN